MSWQNLTMVSERKLGSAPLKAVALCLANHANYETGLTYPSVNRISQETELGESTVRRVLAELRKSGLIEQVKRASEHNPTTYRLVQTTFSALSLVEVWKSDLSERADRPLAAGPEHVLEHEVQVLTPSRSGRSDGLFTAIARTCEVDPKTAGASIGKVASVLAKAGYAAAEVEAFGRWWWNGGFRKRPPRLWDLKEQIGVVRTAKPEPVDRGMPAEVIRD